MATPPQPSAESMLDLRQMLASLPPPTFANRLLEASTLFKSVKVFRRYVESKAYIMLRAQTVIGRNSSFHLAHTYKYDLKSYYDTLKKFMYLKPPPPKLPAPNGQNDSFWRLELTSTPILPETKLFMVDEIQEFRNGSVLRESIQELFVDVFDTRLPMNSDTSTATVLDESTSAKRKRMDTDVTSNNIEEITDYIMTARALYENSIAWFYRLFEIWSSVDKYFPVRASSACHLNALVYEHQQAGLTITETASRIADTILQLLAIYEHWWYCCQDYANRHVIGYEAIASTSSSSAAASASVCPCPRAKLSHSQIRWTMQQLTRCLDFHLKTLCTNTPRLLIDYVYGLVCKAELEGNLLLSPNNEKVFTFETCCQEIIKSTYFYDTPLSRLILFHMYAHYPEHYRVVESLIRDTGKRGLSVLNASPGTGKTYSVSVYVTITHHLKASIMVYSNNLVSNYTMAVEASRLVNPYLKEVDTSTLCRFLMKHIYISQFEEYIGFVRRIVRFCGQPASQEYAHSEFARTTKQQMAHLYEPLSSLDVIVLDEYTLIEPYFLYVFIVLCKHFLPNTRLVLLGDTHQCLTIGARIQNADLFRLYFPADVTLQLLKPVRFHEAEYSAFLESLRRAIETHDCCGYREKYFLYTRYRDRFGLPYGLHRNRYVAFNSMLLDELQNELTNMHCAATHKTLYEHEDTIVKFVESRCRDYTLEKIYPYIRLGNSSSLCFDGSAIIRKEPVMVAINSAKVNSFNACDKKFLLYLPLILNRCYIYYDSPWTYKFVKVLSYDQQTDTVVAVPWSEQASTTAKPIRIKRVVSGMPWLQTAVVDAYFEAVYRQQHTVLHHEQKRLELAQAIATGTSSHRRAVTKQTVLDNLKLYQFPLKVCHSTLASLQGMTIDLSISLTINIDSFDGLRSLYVAFSRVQSERQIYKVHSSLYESFQYTDQQNDDFFYLMPHTFAARNYFTPAKGVKTVTDPQQFNQLQPEFTDQIHRIKRSVLLEHKQFNPPNTTFHKTLYDNHQRLMQTFTHKDLLQQVGKRGADNF